MITHQMYHNSSLGKNYDGILLAHSGIVPKIFSLEFKCFKYRWLPLDSQAVEYLVQAGEEFGREEATGYGCVNIFGRKFRVGTVNSHDLIFSCSRIHHYETNTSMLLLGYTNSIWKKAFATSVSIWDHQHRIANRRLCWWEQLVHDFE